MPESVEVLQERVSHLAKGMEAYAEECREQHRDIKEQIINVHKRFDRINDTLNQLVAHDKAINKIASHLETMEAKTADYEVVRDKAKSASDAIGWVNKIVVGAVVTALLGLILVQSLPKS